MERLISKIEELLQRMGVDDFSVQFDAARNRIAIFINNDSDSFKAFVPRLVSSLDHIARLLHKGEEVLGAFCVDVNNYRAEREQLLVELAKAAARKAAATRSEVELPVMNAYERRLVHVELASRPDVSTESLGEGRNRHVVVKPI